MREVFTLGKEFAPPLGTGDETVLVLLAPLYYFFVSEAPPASASKHETFLLVMHYKRGDSKLLMRIIEPRHGKSVATASTMPLVDVLISVERPSRTDVKLGRNVCFIDSP